MSYRDDKKLLDASANMIGGIFLIVAGSLAAIVLIVTVIYVLQKMGAA